MAAISSIIKSSINNIAKGRTKVMQAVRKLSIAMLVLTVGFYPVAASAFQAPASGSFAYSVYDLFMNEILTGAIGFTIAAGLVLYAIFWAVRSNVFGTIVCAICAGLIIFIEDVVISLGITVAEVGNTVSKYLF